MVRQRGVYLGVYYCPGCQPRVVETKPYSTVDLKLSSFLGGQVRKNKTKIKLYHHTNSSVRVHISKVQRKRIFEHKLFRKYIVTATSCSIL